MQNKTGSRSQWFSNRPRWLQLAAKRLLEHDNFTDDDITKLVDLCKDEQKGLLKNEECQFPSNFFSPSSNETLRLCSIKNMEGINALSSKQTLEFPSDNLSVVYGPNGSGKSSYVRLLKHLCGARNPGILLNNIFDPEPSEQRATLTFKKNGSPITVEWSENGMLEELRTIDIFDTTLNQIFVNQESEVTYEPPVLAFFTKLITICEKVADVLKGEISQHPSKKPELPHQLSETPEAEWYTNLTADSQTSQISFTVEDRNELEQRLRTPSPKEKEHSRFLVNEAKTLLHQLSNDNCHILNDLKKTAELKRHIAKTAIQKAFSVDIEIWKELWSIVKKYPAKENRCVLCAQTLGPEAKERFNSFETFVQDTSQKDAVQAENLYRKAIESLKKIPDQETLNTRADAAGFDEKTKTAMLCFFSNLQTRVDTLPEITPIAPTEWMIPPPEKPLDGIESLQAKKWLFENCKAIEEEIERLRLINQIQATRKLTGTTPLSRKKGELAETLITQEFVQRFNDELIKLGATQIQVELVKSKVSKGRVLHKLQLLNATTNSVKDVLSEGESRLLSIAAFLADVCAKSICSPFIFDDPISLLDHKNEEAVIKRLVELSKTHQVIIFTHRISLLEKVQNHAGTSGIITLS